MTLNIISLLGTEHIMTLKAVLCRYWVYNDIEYQFSAGYGYIMTLNTISLLGTEYIMILNISSLQGTGM